MFSKTPFWFAVVVALVALGSAMAVPIDGDSTASGDETAKVPESVQTTEASSDVTTAGNEPSPQPGQEGVTDNGELKTPAVDLKLPMEKTDRPEVPADVELVTKPNQPGSTLPPNIQRPVQDQYPKPFFTGGVETVNLGPAVPPFFLEFFQPFPGQQPPRQLQSHNPFVNPNNQFNPFMNPMPIPSFDQLVNTYTHEFRPPRVIILKRKRNDVPKTTVEAIPPIPLLMNIMLNAFRQHSPAEDMLEALEKSVVQMDNPETADDEPQKPVGKTTTKTEFINGHLVQTNETTYSGGDAHHKTFYHIKEIQVIPENPNKKIVSNEQTVSTVKDDSESQKEETNEINPNGGQAVGTVKDAADGESNQNDFQKAPGSASLDDRLQTAAATYYAPYAPYGPRPALFYPRPIPQQSGPHYGTPYPAGPTIPGQRPQAPIVGLHGDTYVNQIAAAQQHGAPFALPPDVELIDVHGKPAQLGGVRYFYNNPQHRDGRDKFPGRKN